MDALVHHTLLRFRAEELSSCRESAVIGFAGQKHPTDRFHQEYREASELPGLVEKAAAHGCRTIGIGLPDSGPQLTLAVKEIESHLASSGKQFIYIAFYGGKKSVASAYADLSSRLDRVTPLLFDEAPEDYENAPSNYSFAGLGKAFAGIPFKLPPGLELHLQARLEEKLLRSAFMEYLNVMKTKNVREFRRLYDSTPASRAVASYSAKTPKGERVRLLLYDNNLTTAGEGKTMFADGAFFCKTSFLSGALEPTVVLAGAKATFY